MTIEALAKRRSDYTRNPVRPLMLKAQHGDSQDLESYLENDGELTSSDKQWLADVFAKTRLAKTRGAPSGPRMDDDAAKANLKLAKLCAAYLVRCCTRRHRDWSGKPTPRSVLELLEARALAIVHSHFKITRNKLNANSIIGAKGSKHSAYEKLPHDDIMLRVNSELRKPMREMLAWHAETYFPAKAVKA